MGMKPFTLREIAESCGGKYFGPQGLAGAEISGVERDSRLVAGGSLFLCIKGERADGHDFAGAAYANGALCCLCQRHLDTERPYIVVDDVLAAVRDIAEAYRKKFDIPFIGIIGSVGKTTAKEMTAAVLGRKFSVLKTPENLNNELGVPLTVLSVGQEHTAAVIEMGISDFGEMRRLSKIVRPQICVFTTIGYCHLEFLGDLDGVLRAKSEVFEYMPADGTAVLNGDDGILRVFDPKIEKITFGLSEGCDFTAENIKNLGFDGTDFTIVSPDGKARAHINAFGSHTVSAALAAAAVGEKLGLCLSDIVSGIGDYETVGSRANVIKRDCITIISDCYNANPNSVRAALTSLSGVSGRRVAVLGDMLELGEKSHELHFETGRFAAGSCDCLVCCGPEGKYIYDGFVSADTGKKAWYFRDKSDFLEDIKRVIRSGDTVLVKASHGMHYEEIVGCLENLRF